MWRWRGRHWPITDAGQHVQRGEQGRGAVALVVVGHRAGPAGLDRQRRLGAIQRLDLALLVHAQHDRVLRRVQIQADDVDELLLKPRVVRELERLDPMRLQTRARTRSAAPSPATPQPARPSTGSSSASHPAASRATSSARSPRPSPAGIDGLRPRPGRTLGEVLQPILGEPLAPRRHRRRRHPDLARDPRVREPVRRPSTDAIARCTSRCGAVCERINFSSTDRCSSVTGKRRR